MLFHPFRKSLAKLTTMAELATCTTLAKIATCTTLAKIATCTKLAKIAICTKLAQIATCTKFAKIATCTTQAHMAAMVLSLVPPGGTEKKTNRMSIGNEPDQEWFIWALGVPTPGGKESVQVMNPPLNFDPLPCTHDLPAGDTWPPIGG